MFIGLQHPELEDHPFSAVHDSLFIIFAALLHPSGVPRGSYPPEIPKF
jgi:hypothetical protein